MAELNPNSFNSAFEVLKRNAETLKNQKTPDIDSLVPLVDESIQAYNICKTRIEAVRAALREHLKSPEAGGVASAEDGDDLPF